MGWVIFIVFFLFLLVCAFFGLGILLLFVIRSNEADRREIKPWETWGLDKSDSPRAKR